MATNEQKRRLLIGFALLARSIGGYADPFHIPQSKIFHTSNHKQNAFLPLSVPRNYSPVMPSDSPMSSHFSSSHSPCIDVRLFDCMIVALVHSLWPPVRHT